MSNPFTRPEKQHRDGFFDGLYGRSPNRSGLHTRAQVEAYDEGYQRGRVLSARRPRRPRRPIQKEG